ncbi:MAG: hypothetical protein R3F46_12025 [bacterium]
MSFQRNLSFIVLTMILSLAVSFAGEQGTISEKYPGNGSEITVRLADALVSTGARCFYRAYGRFPDNWDEVVASGIGSTSLMGYQLEMINPDDPTLNFPGDVYYENNRGTAFVHCMSLDGSQERIRLQIPSTYEATLLQMQDSMALTDDQRSRVLQIISDENQLQQFAILGSFSRSIELFRTIHDRYPSDLQEFLSYGFSPVADTTLNPVTGVPFKFDGSAGDIFLEFHSDRMLLIHRDKEGILLPYFDYYF